MRLIEAQEQQFTEGEPDIEPPEESAIGELDDVAQLEEELDNEDILEEDVEEDVLEETLEDLVHGDDDDDSPESPVGLVVAGAGGVEAVDDDDPEDELEEGLDLILEHRLAIVPDDDAQEGDVEDDDPGDVAVARARPGAEDEDEVRPCGPDEFTCHSCFLVRSRELLADGPAQLCRDCSS